MYKENIFEPWGLIRGVDDVMGHLPLQPPVFPPPFSSSSPPPPTRLIGVIIALLGVIIGPISFFICCISRAGGGSYFSMVLGNVCLRGEWGSGGVGEWGEWGVGGEGVGILQHPLNHKKIYIYTPARIK